MTQPKKWSELTTGQRMAGTFGAVLQVTLLAAALWDLWHRPADEIKGDRRVWTAVSFVNFVGPIAYFPVWAQALLLGWMRRWRRSSGPPRGLPFTRRSSTLARLDGPKSNTNRAGAMETKDSYAFPLYHRVGQMARPVIASRWWIVIVLIVAILLYLPFLPSGFFQDDYGFRLNFSPAIYEKYNIPAEVMQNGPLNLYGFSWDSSARFGIEQDKGFAPWWASDQIKTNFFRPLSSLTLALDFSLWPDTPLLMHIHSLLWFCLLIVLTYQLYRSVSGSAVVAGISILLFVMDDVLSGPVGWISNRHAVVAMVFAVLCLWLYHRGVSKQKWPYIAGAYGTYALALLASEMGLVTFAYLFAYLLVLDRDKWPGRVKRIAPFVLITVVWRLGYTGLGYGARGTLLYIDPILNPVDFITQMLTRIPVLLFSAAVLPVADLLLAFSPQALAVAAALFLIPVGLLVLAAYPLLKTHRASTFWAIGLLGAVIPLVAGIPQSRNLGLVSLGVMALAGQLLVDVAIARKPGPLTTFQRILLRITIPILVDPLSRRFTPVGDFQSDDHADVGGGSGQRGRLRECAGVG